MAKHRKANREANTLAKNVIRNMKNCNEAYTTGAFKYLRLLLHLLGAAQFIYALYFWCNYVHIPITNPAVHGDDNIDWGGKFKFLTFLDLILQAIYHVIALLNDLLGSNAVMMEKTPLLRQLKDFIFAVFAYPISHNVCACFWGVYTVDRELVFPSALDEFFPNWLNHVVHTNVAMLIILDLFTCFRRYPKRTVGLTSIASVMFLYVGWLHLAHFYSGRWAYPMFDYLNWPLCYFMLFGMVIVSIICYLAGEFLNNFIWAPELELLAQKEKIKSL